MQKFQTKLKELWEKVKGFFKKLNKKIRILLAACAVVLLAAIILLAVRMNQKEYAVLYTGLTASETSTIVKYLGDNGVADFQIQGDTILVPKGRESQLQAQLAMSGYPTTGTLYESYRNGSSGLNISSEQDRLWLISKMENLSMVLRQLEGVRDATVEIEPGTERIYVLDPEATPATAAVSIILDGNKALSSKVAAAIRNTVAHSVAGLEISNVSITDNLGNTYTDASGMGEMAEASAMKLQYEEEINNKVRTQILQNLTPIYGEGNVNVAVNSTVDVNHRIVEATSYHQPEGSTTNGGLIGTEKIFWEIIRDGTEPVGGTVGTPTNSDIPIYSDLQPELNNNESYAGFQDERDNRIDTTVEQREELAGKITDIGVAVTINQNSPNSASLSLEDLREHVAVISGIGSEDPVSRVSVLIAPFAVDNPLPGPIGWNIQPWMLYAAIAGLALFLVLLILILLVLRRRKKKKLAQQKALEEEALAAEAEAVAAAAAAAVPPAGGADIMEVNTEKSMELRKMVRQFAQNNPEIAAQMVKAWLRGDDDNG